GNGRYSLLLSFNQTGADAWSRLTGDNVGRDIAIVINDRVWSAPRVQEQINMGKCMITGNFSKKEVNELKEQIDQQP
ncbi:MAG: SecDF P1 head subdomain-containing protein, partial [Bacteroidales bacterium]